MPKLETRFARPLLEEVETPWGHFMPDTPTRIIDRDPDVEGRVLICLDNLAPNEHTGPCHSVSVPIGHIFRWPATTAHGTKKGYDRHNYQGEPACGPCRRAQSTWSLAERIRSGQASTVRVTIPLLRELLDHAPVPLLELADAQIGAPIVDVIRDSA